MSLTTICQSIVTKLKIEIPELKTLEISGGKVFLEQVQDMSRTLPGGWLACMGTREGQTYGDKFRTRALFSFCLSTKSGAGAANDKSLLILELISKSLAVIAAGKDWGDEEVGGSPLNVQSRNPYNQPTFQNNLATWEITWEQDVVLGKPGLIPLDDFLVAEVDYKSPESLQIDTHSTIVPEQDP